LIVDILIFDWFGSAPALLHEPIRENHPGLPHNLKHRKYRNQHYIICKGTNGQFFSGTESQASPTRGITRTRPAMM